jgi:hypothetical protein
MVHELAHMVQLYNGAVGGPFDPPALLEREATTAERGAIRSLSDIAGKASPESTLPLWWLIPIAAGVYSLLRPSAANAPAPADKVYPSVSTGQVAAEAFALFAIPGAGYAISGRLGLGWIASSAISGSLATTSFRGVQDVSRGEFSGATVYIFDAVTGAIIAVLIGGTFVLVGKGMQGTSVAIDNLATRGLHRSEVIISERLAKAASASPKGLDTATVNQISGARPLQGRISQWWLDRRGQLVLWRGQGKPTVDILSPVARDQSVAASRSLAHRARAAGFTDKDIAAAMSFHNGRPLPRGMGYPQAMVGEPVGGVGIPMSGTPGIAAHFGEGGVVYLIRLPKGAAVKVPPWGLALENEYAVFHKLPEGAIVDIFPASRISALKLDGAGRLITGGK